MFEGKVVMALGERDGVPGPVIAEVLRAIGCNVVYEVTECFV